MWAVRAMGVASAMKAVETAPHAEPCKVWCEQREGKAAQTLLATHPNTLEKLNNRLDLGIVEVVRGGVNVDTTSYVSMTRSVSIYYDLLNLPHSVNSGFMSRIQRRSRVCAVSDEGVDGVCL